LPILGSNAELLILSSIISKIGVKRLAFIASLNIINSKRNGRNLSVLLNNSSKLRKTNNAFFNLFKKRLYAFFRPLEKKLRSNNRLKSSSSNRLGNNSVNSKLINNSKHVKSSKLKSSYSSKLNSSKLGNNKL